MTQCPLCERPARFERTREFPAPRRHYRCVCAEFIVDDSGAKTLAAAGKVMNRGLIEDAASRTSATDICIFEVHRGRGGEDVQISSAPRVGILR